MKVPDILNIKTINGRITVVLIFLVLNFTAFSVYILYENNRIKNKFYLLSTQAEPVITLKFIADSRHFLASYILLQAILHDETKNYRKDFFRHLNEESDMMKLIKLHCDTLNVPEYAAILSEFDAKQAELKVASNTFFDIIDDRSDKKLFYAKYGTNNADSLIKSYFNTQFSPKYWASNGVHGKIEEQLRSVKESSASDLKARTSRIVVVIGCVLFFILILSWFVWYKTSTYLSSSISKTVHVLKDMAQGILKKQEITRNDEVGQILAASNILVENLQTASNFASHIGKGDFTYQFSPASEKDILGLSLMDMRNDLQKFKLDDEKRLWINEGFAKFGEILRTNNTNLSALCEHFIGELVKYLNANQGSLFMANEGKDGVVHLEMKSCYAYSRKKYIDSKIEVGEGLVGQAFLEKDFIYLTSVPDDYIKITSGLGAALPKAVLIMPIVIEELAMGVIEIASFDEFEAYQIEFVKKLGSDLASVLQSVQTNDKTQILVSQLQERTEQMHSQEEEIRQNMEELMATQEEIMRKEEGYLQTIKLLKTENEQLKKMQMISLLN